MSKEESNLRKRAIRFLFAFILFAILLILSEDYIQKVSKHLASILSHLGLAILIAAFVGVVIEFVEIKQYLEERLFSILLRNEYLDELSEGKIKTLIEKSFESLINRRKSNPDYDSLSLPKEIKDRMLNTLGKTYYEEYTERIEYKEVNPEDVFGVDPQFNKDIVSFNVRTSIVLISPYKDAVTNFILQYPWAVKKIPNLIKEKHFDISLFIDDVNQHLEYTVDETRDLVKLDIQKPISFKNRANITWICKCYMYGIRNFYSSFVSEWTKEAEIIFNTNKPCDSYIEISGITGETTPLDVTDYGANMKYRRWLAPKQGFFVSWTEKEENN